MEYVHGYSNREALRLADQADTLTGILHSGTAYPSGSRVLEAGCGVGAQTIALAKNSPEAEITSIDISRESLSHAESLIRSEGISNVNFKQADIINLPFPENSFDHVFVCFVLEHLQNPEVALQSLKRVLKRGGSITVIEGDHGSCYFHPETEEAVRVWGCLVQSQRDYNGNPMIGRELHPLLNDSGFRNVEISPKIVYVDSNRPELVDGFIKKTIIAMVEGVKDQAIEKGMINIKTWNPGNRGSLQNS
ncbi:Ubiquinone/menaquinone biosynthesis C-methyltransferase UbiE [anaerobic digester metagenome]